jgi:glycosyltransferase involved in cell wall biosynthesis
MSANDSAECAGGEAESGRLIIRHCGNAHRHMCRYLVERHGFEDLCRLPVDPGSKSRLAHFRDLAGDLLYAVRNLPRLRRAREIVSTGPMAAAVACLLKLGLLPRCRHVWWLGLFIHSPRWLRRLRPVFRLLDSRRMRYLLFSEFEKAIYARALGFELYRLLYISYGDMSPQRSVPDERIARQLATAGRTFFFSGGYTSRDYSALIEVFRQVSSKLVIICSSLNTNVPTAGLPANITVLREVPFATFEAYAQAALACIVPIAYDTGAAGQSVLLSHMQQRKIIIATNTGIIREYLQDGVSGILVENNRTALAAAVQRVAAHPEDYQHYGDAAHARFQQCFSREAIARRLDELVHQHMALSGERPPEAV